MIVRKFCTSTIYSNKYIPFYNNSEYLIISSTHPTMQENSFPSTGMFHISIGLNEGGNFQKFPKKIEKNDQKWEKNEKLSNVFIPALKFAPFFEGSGQFETQTKSRKLTLEKLNDESFLWTATDAGGTFPFTATPETQNAIMMELYLILPGLYGWNYVWDPTLTLPNKE
eukprot:GHVL01025136.1.p1 GENE.GHVL01025136.1~~GHVL01025136.1.p1  ORF type:complete len:169 (-),score=34.77 GHVL01025136.1:30-536(-)